MKKEILSKYLNNRCSSEEFEQFSDWVNHEALSEDGKFLGLNDWNTFHLDEKNANDNLHYLTLLDRIHHKINLKNNSNSKEKTHFLSNTSFYFYRAAAVLLFPLLAVVLYFMMQNRIQGNTLSMSSMDSLEIISPIGSRTVVQLSDGTVVNMNYGSSIKYPRVFTGNTREVKLKGEAYFNVAHNPNKPFIVETGKFNIKALGTEFNVHAYVGDDIVSTTLVKGKVVLERVVKNNKVGVIGNMIPGEHVDYDVKLNKAELSKGNIEKYIAWKDGRLMFDDEPLSNIAKEFSRMYNVEIDVEKDVRDYTYTVTFVNEPLSFMLDLMTETTPIKYEVFPRKKLADGTYSKKRIVIRNKK